MTEQLVKRLRELASAVTRADWGQFSMRVPVEKDRDADFVLIVAANTIATQAAEITRLKAKNERLRVLVDSQKRWLWDMSIKHNDGARFIAEQCGAQCDELAQALAAIAQTAKPAKERDHG